MSVLTDLIYGGANAVAGLTEGAVNDAIAKYGADRKAAFPDTAYFCPTIYAATGVKVKTLGDLPACVGVLKSLITNKEELGEALNAGLAGTYQGETLINSWFGSLFTYQFSHAFIDFRDIVDENGTNWFDNSVSATIANYKYCVANPQGFTTFAKDQWGTTACDTPSGYSGLIGAYPSGNGNEKKFTNDGTIACCGAIGSLPFAPDLVMPVFRNYATLLDGALVGDYGFKDAFNFDGQKPWIANSVIGIDKGITVLMIENYRSEIIWKTFMQIDYIQTALEVLGFTKA